MEHYELVILQNKYESSINALSSVINRMVEDIDSYKSKHQTLSSGQKIYIEVREAAIARMLDYIQVSETMLQLLMNRLKEMNSQSQIPKLTKEISHLKSENRKMSLVLSRGYGYDLSLLNYQRENDFF
ncbi:MAG: hypothetical protein LC105_05355 [Chitinophagales bacterium]|nr:hypothetical protein [Chitinophagales bacterium]